VHLPQEPGRSGSKGRGQYEWRHRGSKSCVAVAWTPSGCSTQWRGQERLKTHNPQDTFWEHWVDMEGSSRVGVNGIIFSFHGNNLG
jgi:hypothetical protein